MRKALLLMLAFALFAPVLSAQADATRAADSAGVTVGRHVRVAGVHHSKLAKIFSFGRLRDRDEQHELRTSMHFGPNPVTYTWRHCQSYADSDGVLRDAGREACAADPNTVFYRALVHNLLTNAGKDLISKAVSDTAAQPAACNYIAVTNTAITPAAGDTTLSGEISTNGLSRAQAAFAHTNGQSTYTLIKTFTATATQASQAAGVFNASSAGSMCFENTYTQVTLNNNDTLTITWTITLSRLFGVPPSEILAMLRKEWTEIAIA